MGFCNSWAGRSYNQHRYKSQLCFVQDKQHWALVLNIIFISLPSGVSRQTVGQFPTIAKPCSLSVSITYDTIMARKIERKTFIETERFILREILLTDIDGMFELDSDPDVHKYLGNQPVTEKEQLVNVINFIRQQYLDNGIGRWAIIDKKTKDFIGWTGLKFVSDLTNNHKNYYDLGYRLIKKYWGKGIASETAIAMLKYAFEHLQAEEVYAMADCNNDGSNKVLKKVGLNCIEKFYLEGIEHNWYKIERKEYENINLNR